MPKRVMGYPQRLRKTHAVGKRFAITERIHLGLRLDSYNALNHVNLNPPSSNLSSSNFGRSTSALLPRQYQGGARIEF